MCTRIHVTWYNMGPGTWLQKLLQNKLPGNGTHLEVERYSPKRHETNLQKIDRFRQARRSHSGPDLCMYCSLWSKFGFVILTIVQYCRTGDKCYSALCPHGSPHLELYGPWQKSTTFNEVLNLPYLNTCIEWIFQLHPLVLANPPRLEADIIDDR